MKRLSKNLLAYICVNNITIKTLPLINRPIYFWHKVLGVPLKYGCFSNRNSITTLELVFNIELATDLVIRWFRYYAK